MKEYRTTNLYEASFLACRGINFTGKERNGNKVILIFPNSKDLAETVAEFYSGGQVSAKQYSDWYRTLKDYVFS
jgi:hypothetical protein